MVFWIGMALSEAIEGHIGAGPVRLIVAVRVADRLLRLISGSVNKCERLAHKQFYPCPHIAAKAARPLRTGAAAQVHKVPIVREAVDARILTHRRHADAISEAHLAKLERREKMSPVGDCRSGLHTSNYRGSVS
jgi:hypothetical protein